ncbi:MAG: FHA domain-containing protein [Phormidesmis sp.]
MITCPNCNHQNPDGALQCEACYTPLPALTTCPNCQAPVQADASFCGQCGNDLRQTAEQSSSPPSSTSPVGASAASVPTNEVANEPESDPFGEFSQSIDFEESINFDPSEEVTEALVAPVVELETEPTVEVSTKPAAEPSAEAAIEPASALEESAIPPVIPSAPVPTVPATQIQAPGVALKHVQTQTSIAIPSQLSVVRIGKPNEHTPPDIDVSGLPDSEVVSRVHANLVIEDDVFYLEDMGSSNGTYINGLPLPTGNRHRLRVGDRIAFGKGDKVSFIFEAAGY